MAGVVTRARISLFRHPSFWAEEAAECLPDQILEDPRIIRAENEVYSCLAEQTVAFCTSLDEHTINVGFSSSSSHSEPRKDCFRRTVADYSSELSEFDWKDRHLAYQQLNKLHLGHERVISETDPEGSERRIHRRLSCSRLEAHPPVRAHPNQDGGGNSLFEAFCTALWGTPTYHLLLRQLVVDYMREEPELYAPALGRDYAAYLDFMANPGVAGDELIIRALADRFGLPITVVTGDEVVWLVRYPPKATVSQREVFLAVAPAANFSAIRKQSAMTSLKMTFSSREEAKQARALRKRMASADLL